MLMENANSQISGNFDAKFFTDPKVNIELRYESKQTTRLVFSHKNVCNFEIQASKLSQITPMIVEGYASENAGSENKIDAESYLQRIKHAWVARENAQKLEVSLSETESKMCEFSLFPAIFSMRPSSTDTGQDVTPLSTAPNSARGSNSTKSGNSMSTSVQREIQSTGNTVNQGSLGSIHASDIASFVVSPPQKRDGSLVTRPKRQIGSHRRTKRVPDKGWVTDLGDGNIWCQFEDGSQIEHNLQAKLSTYTDVDGNYKQFASNGTSQNLPPDLRTKMRLSAEMTKYLSK